MTIKRNCGKKAFLKTTVILLTAFLAFSCAVSPGIYRDIDLAVENNDFETAIAALAVGQEAKRPIYSEKKRDHAFSG